MKSTDRSLVLGPASFERHTPAIDPAVFDGPVIGGLGNECMEALPPDTRMKLGEYGRCAVGSVNGHKRPPQPIHNIAALARLPDPRLSEFVWIPESTPGFKDLYWFDPTGAVNGSDPVDSALTDAWDLCNSLFGRLEWPVRVLASPHEWPRAVSYPGLVLISEFLPPAALTTRWLYLLHELLHQWFGAVIRFPSDSHQLWEACVDAVTWCVAESVLGASSTPAYEALYRRYAASGNPDLVRRADWVHEARKDIMGAGSLAAHPLGALSRQMLESLRRGNSDRKVVPAPRSKDYLESEPCSPNRRS